MKYYNSRNVVFELMDILNTSNMNVYVDGGVIVVTHQGNSVAIDRDEELTLLGIQKLADILTTKPLPEVSNYV